MHRLFDWECTECNERSEFLFDVPGGGVPPKSISAYCSECSVDTKHDRMISLPAPYTGEQTRNPEMRGGNFDTCGMQKLPDLPEMKGEAEYQRRCQDAIRGCSPNASSDEINSAMAKVVKTHGGPSASDYDKLFRSSAYQDAERRRAEVKKRNAAKKKRLAAIRRGEAVNMRRDRLPGDPRI